MGAAPPAGRRHGRHRPGSGRGGRRPHALAAGASGPCGLLGRVCAARRAQANLRLALDALGRVYLQAIEDRAPRDPGREREDRRLLEDALAFYGRFAEENADDPAVRVERARAFLRVGQIRVRLGRTAAGEEAIRKAIELFEQEGDDPEARDGLADALTEYGSLLERGRRLPEAEHAHRRSVALRERLIADRPGLLRREEALADALDQLARLPRGVGRRGDLERVLRRSLVLKERLGNEPAAVRPHPE